MHLALLQFPVMGNWRRWGRFYQKYGGSGRRPAQICQFAERVLI